MTARQDGRWQSLLEKQKKDHQPGYEKEFRDYLTSMRGFDLEYSSPRRREAEADKHAGQTMAQKEAHAQSKMLKEFAAMREGYLDQMNHQIARSSAQQSVNNANEKGHSR